MKLVLSTLALAALLTACGPKSEPKSDSTADTNKAAVEKTDSVVKPAAPKFEAHGNEPFWSLQVFEKEIKFKLADKDTVTASDYKYTANADGSETYVGGKDFGFTVTNKAAKDGMGDKTFAKTVSISFQGKKYNGVGGNEVAESTTTTTTTTKTTVESKTVQGKPIDKNDRITINGEWILDAMNGKKIGQANFANGMPTLVINTVEKTGSGFGGCNRFNGTLTIFDGKKIKIEKIIATKMFCDGVAENDYLSALRNATNFAVEAGKLVLKNDAGKALATFVRGVK